MYSTYVLDKRISQVLTLLSNMALTTMIGGMKDNFGDEGLGKYWRFKEVEEDNFVFKLFTKTSFAICIAAAICILTFGVFGDPIDCDVGDSVDKDVFTRHCYIHGSTHIGQDFLHQVRKQEDEGNGYCLREEVSLRKYGSPTML